MEHNSVDLGPLARSPDFLAAFDCRGAMPVPIGRSGDDGTDAAARAPIVRTAWHAARRLPGVRSAVWRGAGRTNLASDHGAILVEGTAKLNLGVARVALRDLATVAADPALIAAQPTFAAAWRQALWSVLLRADRAEVARVMILRSGESRIGIHVHRGAIRFLDAAIAPGDLLAILERADGAVDYTLGEAAEAPTGEAFGPGDFLGAAPGGPWRFDSDGWPLCCPTGVSFTTLADAVGLVRACGPIWGRGIAGDCLLMDAAGGRLAHIWMADDGLAGLGSGTLSELPN